MNMPLTGLDRTMARIPYSSSKAVTYARDYCKQKSNICGVYLDGPKKSDSAHFIAHCLAAGGLEIRNTNPDSARCPHGLAEFNVDLEAQLKEWSYIYENIKEIDLSDAMVGDIGFLHAERPRHAFMIAAPWNAIRNPFSTPKAWAHSTARCGEEMDTDFRHWFTSAYRLEDG